MADYRKHEILSGLFIMIAVVVFSLFAFKVGDLDLFALFRGEALDCRAFFTDVKSLNTGAAVKIGGQRVGKVTGVEKQEVAGFNLQLFVISFAAEKNDAESSH